MKKEKLMISSILFKNNVPVEEAKIIGSYIEKLENNWNELKEQIQELKHIMYVIRDDNGFNHLWCKDMILDWLESDDNE